MDQFSILLLLLLLLLQSALQPSVGFRPVQLSLSILSRKVLQSVVASGTSNPNMEENQGFRTFQLSPQEATSVWSDASEPSSGRWNYWREMAENFAESGDFHVTLGSFTCRNARHGTDGFTSPPKEGVLTIFWRNDAFLRTYPRR
jgi:hypothetical protein